MSLLIFFRHGARKRTSIRAYLGRVAVKIIRYRPVKTNIRYYDSFLFLIESEKREYNLVHGQKILNFDSAKSLEFFADSRDVCFQSVIKSV